MPIKKETSYYKSIKRKATYCLGILLGIAVIFLYLHYFFGIARVEEIGWLNLEMERNIAALFSGALLSLFGWASIFAYYLELKTNAEKEQPVFRLPVLWVAVGIAGLAMSLDKITSFHVKILWPKLGQATNEIGPAGSSVNLWQILFALTIILLLGYFILFFSNRFISSTPARRAAFAGMGLWFIALLLESVRANLDHTSSGWESSGLLFEKMAEMGSASLLLAAIAFYTIDIALDLTDERRKKLASASKFLTPRALKALGVALLTMIITVSITFYFISKSIKTRASISNLQKQEIEESIRATQLASFKQLPPVVQPDEIWFDNIKISEKISDEDARALARYVATAVFEPKAVENTAPDIINSDISPRTVFISIGNAKSSAKVIRGVGKGIKEAIKNALMQVQPLTRTGFRTKWIKFDIVQDIFFQDNISPSRPLPPNFERSLYGLAFDRASGLAFLPEELVSRTLVDSRQKLRFENMESYLNKLSRPTEHAKRLGSEERLTVYRFSLASFFSEGKEPIPLYRGHRVQRRLSKRDLISAAVSGAQYLTQNVGSDGRFVYIYWPKTNRISTEYNILRHAGTTYSMFELYEVTHDASLLRAAERALGYLVQTARPLVEGSEDLLGIVEEREVKLGGNALAAIALVKHMDATGSREHLALLIALGKWIVSVQDESGRFSVHKQSYPDGRIFRYRSQYYPGEALLALNRIYSIDKKESWLDAAERGAQYLIKVRDRGLSIEQLAHDHWLLYALNELYRHRPKPVYLNHALRIAEAIVQSQNKKPAYPDWLGSYYDPPRSTPTATRSEGLYAAYLLARDFASAGKAQPILEAINLGLTFQLQTQFRPESVMYLENPQRCLGGFHGSLTNYAIRIDYVQHNISSLLGLYRLKVQGPSDG